MSTPKRETNVEKVVENLKSYIVIAIFEDGYESTPITDKPAFYDSKILEGSGEFYTQVEALIKDDDKIKFESKLKDFCNLLVAKGMQKDFDGEAWYRLRAKDFVDEYKELCVVEKRSSSEPIYM